MASTIHWFAALFAFARMGVMLAMPMRGSVECPCKQEMPSTNYGIGCQKHDLNSTRCKGGNPPSWCSDMWCYVEEDSCTVYKAISNSRTGAWYSYATCGSQDRYTPETDASSLVGATVRVSYLANSGGWKGNFCDKPGPAFCQQDVGSGPLQTFMQSLAVSVGFQLEWVKGIPPAVKELATATNPDMLPFDMCAHATGMGFLDLCIGVFVETPKRTESSKFITLWHEPVYLVAHARKHKTTLGDHLAIPFEPFDEGLWAMILIVVILVSCLIMLLEGDFRNQRPVHAVGMASYKAAKSMVSGSSAFEPKTRAGRIAALGLGFFLLLSVSGYTANLASFLVLKKTKSIDVTSLDDVLKHGYPVCAHWADMSGLLSTGFPEKQTVEFVSRSDVLPAIGSKCRAAVIRAEDFDKAREGGKICDITRVGDPLWYVAIGMPVSNKMQWPLVAHITTAKFQGKLDEVLRRFQFKESCVSGTSGSGVDDDDPEPLFVTGMLGPLIVTGMVAGAAVVVHVFERAKKHTLESEEWVNERVGRMTRKIVGMSEGVHNTRMTNDKHSTDILEALGPTAPPQLEVQQPAKTAAAKSRTLPQMTFEDMPMPSASKIWTQQKSVEALRKETLKAFKKQQAGFDVLRKRVEDLLTATEVPAINV